MKHRTRTAALVLAASVILTGSVAAATTGPTGSAQAQEAPKPKKSFAAGKYIITLRDDAVATYDGGVQSYAATRAPHGSTLNSRSKKAQSYAGYLESEQKSVAANAGVTVSDSYTLTLNGFTSTLTSEQAQALYADYRVVSVVPDELLHATADQTSTGFLGLPGDNGVWSKLGGVSAAGAGVVVGVIDTGIAPENPSFAGDALGSTKGDAPWRDGDTIRFTKADGNEFAGACQTGEQFNADDCNTKIIGARYFIDDASIGALPGAEHGEYQSPRDGEGHGSHTASTAAGNTNVPADVAGAALGEISGVAPAAKIAAYKVCWEFVSGAGCYTGDIIAAIDQAVADGVDVINYSIGGGGAQTTVSPTDQAFLGAAAAGVFVAASAGNDGPDSSTADNAAPWETTVAATTIPPRETTVELGDGEAFLGGSITLPATGSFSGPLVSAVENNIAGKRPSALCEENTLDPAKVAGKIVMCERGVNDRTAKSVEVKRAGGVGMLLVNPAPNSIDLDVHVIPTVHVDADAYPAIKAYASTPGATVTFRTGNTRGLPTAPAPQVAGFSSRGPVLAEGGDILKPDLAAPGVAILADGANPQDGKPTFAFMSGTSMASPHVAGLAALYFGAHPKASPMEVKSALMTTAYPTVDSSGTAIGDPFAQGAGQVDPTQYLHPGFVYLTGVADWMSYIQGTGALNVGATPIDPSDLNIPSVSIGALAGSQTVTRTVTATSAGDYTAQPVAMAGVDVQVTPSTLHFSAAGETASYTVTFLRTDAPLDEFTTGYLRWTGTTDVVTPLAIRPISIGTPHQVSGTGTDGSTPILIQPGIDGTVTAKAMGLARGETVSGVSTQEDNSLQYVFTVPTGTSLAAFVLDAADSSADLDLKVTMLAQNRTIRVGEGTSPQADETVTIDSPDAGTYIAEVVDTEGTSAFTLTAYSLGADNNEGSFRADPASVGVALNSTTTVTPSWSGLKPGSTYLGRVAFHATETSTGNEADSSTLVTVTTPGTTPSTTVNPRLSTAAPAALPGLPVTVLATGFTPGVGYTIDIDGTPLAAGIVDSHGNASRMAPIPADISFGSKTISITTEDGVTLHTPFEVAKLVLRSVVALSVAAFDGSPDVHVELSGGGTGTYRVVIDTKAGKEIFREDLDVTGSPDLADSNMFTTSTRNLPAGDYVAHAWVLTDNKLTQELAEPFTAAESAPSKLSLTQGAEPNSVDLAVTDNSDQEFRFQVRYKLCSGPIVASTYRVFLGDNTDTLPLSGIARVDFLLAGKQIGSFTNTSVDRCTGTPQFTQPMNVTFSAAKSSGESTKASPVTATMRYQYQASVASLDLSAGYGPVLKSGEISHELIPVELVDRPGPFVERSFSVDEGKQFWVNADFEIFTGTKHILARQEVQAEPVTVAMLAPVVGPGDHGNPGNPPAGDAPSDGSPAAGPGTSNGSPSSLASTGSDLLPALLLGVLLVLAGVVTAAARIRRGAGRV